MEFPGRANAMPTALPIWAQLVPTRQGIFLVDVLTPVIFRIDPQLAVLLEGIQAGRFAEDAISSEVRQFLQASGLWNARGTNDLDSALQRIRGVHCSVYPDTPRISSFRIVLTEACNLRCSYCFVTRQKRRLRRPRLKLVLDRILSLAAGGSLEEVQFFGGEPMLAFDLMQFTVQYLESKRRDFSIDAAGYSLTTNGTVLPTDAITFLRKHNFVVDISIDGHESVTDAARGKGVYARAMETYTLMRLAGIDTGLIMTPTPENFRQIPTFIEFAAKRMACSSFTINSPQPSPDGWALPGAEFAETVTDCLAVCQDVGVSLSSPADRVLRTFQTLTPHYNACIRYSGNFGLLVDANGNFRYCDVNWTLPDFVVTENELDDIEAIGRTKLTMNRFPKECLCCVAFAACGGPCPLEHRLNPLDHLTNTNRCAFNRRIAQFVLEHEYGGRSDGKQR